MKLTIKSVTIEIEGEVSDLIEQRQHFADLLGLNGQEQAAPASTPSSIRAGKPASTQGVSTLHASTPRVLTKAPQRSAGEMDWKRYPVRTALAEHGPCVICKRPILKHATYYDGNNEARRVHFDCVADQPAKASA